MKHFKRLVTLAAIVALIGTAGLAGANDKLANWKPKFDPSGAKYVMKVSNISHPVIEGVGSGYRIRDRLWEETNGQIFYDYYPLAQMGGEVEVLNQLMMGSVQGMLCSSVAAANVSEKLGIVNLPFLVNSFDKLDKFIGNDELFGEYKTAAVDKGLMTVDVTGYGNYGWATVKPVTSIAAAKTMKFRVAEAPVNQNLYKQWGLNAVVMPWPDVPVSLKQGVIDGLDHTPMVCNITKKFEVAKNFVQINYAQGLFIHMLNKAWFDGLPADLQATLLKVIKEECANTRDLTRKQEAAQIEKAKANGITFVTLSDADMATLASKGDAVHDAWADKIGADYLKKVQDALGYTGK